MSRSVVVVLSCASVLVAGCPSSAGDDDDAPALSVLIAPALTEGKPGQTASIASADPGGAYTWSGDFGVIDSGQGTSSIVFTAGAAGTRSWSVTRNGATAEGTTTVLEMPSSCGLSADSVPAAITRGRVGLRASVASQPDAVLTWAISGPGVIASGGTSNSISFDALDEAGPAALSCTACNALADCAPTAIAPFTVVDRGYEVIYGAIGVAGDAFTLPEQSQSAGTARFNSPRGLASFRLQGLDFLFVADTGNNCLRQVVGDAVSVPFGLDCNPAGGTTLTGPQGVAVSRQPEPNVSDAHDVVIADSGNSCLRWFVIDGAGYVAKTTIGLCGSPGTANGDGATARFNAPTDVVIDGPRNAIYVSEYTNGSVRRVSMNAPYDVTTIVGLAGTPGNTIPAVGGTPIACTAARITNPHGLALSRDGNTLFVVENSNAIKSIAVDLDAATCVQAGTPVGLHRHGAIDFEGRLHVTNTVLNYVRDLTGANTVGDGTDNAPLPSGALSDALDDPDGIAVDSRNGDLLITSSTQHVIVRVRH